MLALSSSAKIYICKEPINMLNGFEGLLSTVSRIFEILVVFDAYFVFVNKKYNRLKVLYWDGDGYVIWYKRLEKGRFLFKNLHQNLIDRKAFLMLLEGITPKHINKRYKV